MQNMLVLRLSKIHGQLNSSSQEKKPQSQPMTTQNVTAHNPFY